MCFVFLFVMKIFIDKNNEEKELFFNGFCSDLLKTLNISFKEVLVLKNEELVSLEEHLEDDDEIRLISIVSGGVES